MPTNYDVSLDEIIKKNRKKRSNKSTQPVRSEGGRSKLKASNRSFVDDRKKRTRTKRSGSYASNTQTSGKPRNRNASIRNRSKENYRDSSVRNRSKENYNNVNSKLIKARLNRRSSQNPTSAANKKLNRNKLRQRNDRKEITSKQNSIIKTSIAVAGQNRKEVRLFTSHFDARDKLSAKGNTKPDSKNAKRGKSRANIKGKDIARVRYFRIGLSMGQFSC